MALPKHLIICNFLVMWKCKIDLHLISILNVICPSSEATCHACPPPRCLSCCLVHCPLCGLLCVNHDSFCGSVTLVSEVHREAALAFSLAEFLLWRIVVWSSCFVLEVKESALITASLHGPVESTREADGVNIVFILCTVCAEEGELCLNKYTCVTFSILDLNDD